MTQLSWNAAVDGRYWISAAIGGRPVPVMIDLGLVDPSQAVGFEIEPVLYEQLKRAGRLSMFQIRFRRDASSNITSSESGFTTAQLLDPLTKQGVGPIVQLHVCRGVPGIPNRVGVVFFHRLIGCSVAWLLDNRTWQIECP